MKRAMDFSANSRHTFTANDLDQEKLSATIEPPEPQKPVASKQEKEPPTKNQKRKVILVCV